MSEPMQTLYRIEGNSYPVRDQLKALGAKWDGKDKHWWIHQDRLEEAKAIVAKVPPKEPYKPKERPARKPIHCKCPTCGTEFTI